MGTEEGTGGHQEAQAGPGEPREEPSEPGRSQGQPRGVKENPRRTTPFTERVALRGAKLQSTKALPAVMRSSADISEAE